MDFLIDGLLIMKDQDMEVLFLYCLYSFISYFYSIEGREKDLVSNISELFIYIDVIMYYIYNK